MALINCLECNREISDKALSCPGCGAPISQILNDLPKEITYNNDRTFTGTMPLMVKLAMKATQNLNWKIVQTDITTGLVTFQTGITWGSWSGVIGTLNIEEISKNIFTVSGTAKQNKQGLQMIAFNLGNEAESKLEQVIDNMILFSEK